jgi:AraC-like DNA-binding protein
MILAIICYLLQSALCLFEVLKVLSKRKVDNQHLFSQSKEDGIHLLEILSFALVLFAVVNSCRLLYCAFFDNIQLVNISIAFVQTSVVFVFCFLLLRLLNLQQINQEHLRAKVIRNTQNQKYAHSSISDRRLEELKSSILSALDTDKLYIQPGLSLQCLSQHVNENPHIVSQAISVSDLGTFHELVNTRRVEYAKYLLSSDLQKTVLEIALHSGFNAKSTFNKVFKSIVGQTPTEYRHANTSILNELSGGTK